ncbi:MAG: DUF4249 domain-containing protein [Chitinophagaceae bacterium]|nr:MAG: DUF4249 domain-containing protein [Chitinophagaceae bacterium]
MQRAFERTKLLYLTFLAVAAVLAPGCEKDIQFDLKEEAPKLVVEATIENGQPPVVVLTSSLNYFSQISPELLTQSFVKGAEVYVSNGSRTHQLKEYVVPVIGNFSLRYYSTDSSNLSTAFVGELNKSYSLRIVADGKEYTAITTIPNITKRIDSIWYKAGPPQLDTSKVIVMIRATDPPGFGDYVRYFTKRNNGPFLPGLNSAFDDLFIDGTTYELQVGAGVDRNKTIKEDDLFFNKGDTVTFKLSNIDRATYDFWRTMEFSYQSVGNPFSTPIKVSSNISGNALGYFGGYASQYRTLIIKR